MADKPVRREDLVPLFPGATVSPTPVAAPTAETGMITPQTSRPFTPAPVSPVQAVASGGQGEVLAQAAVTPIRPNLVPMFPPSTVDVLPSSVAELDRAENIAPATEGWWEDPMMASRAALDGITFGFSDEIGASMVASFVAAAQVASGEGEAKWSDVYDSVMYQLQDERNVYTAANPKASLALNIVGGIASPVNKPLGLVVDKAVRGVGAIAPTLRHMFNGSPGLSARSQQALARMEQRGAPALLPENVAPTGFFTAAKDFTVRNAPVAAAGGALFGAGAAEQGEKAQGAAQGAIAGLVATPVIAALPGIHSVLSRRRVAQQLGKGKDAVPLTLAADTTANPILSGFYRNIVGRAFVGRSTLDSQAQRWYTPVMRKVDEFEVMLKEARKLSQATYAAVSARAAEEGKKLAAIVRANKSAKRASLRAIIGDIRAIEKKLAKNAVDSSEMEQIAVLTEQMFRSQAFQAALPDSFPASVRDEILSLLSTGQSAKALDKLRSAWNTHGFDMLNKGRFQIGEVVKTTQAGTAPLLGGTRPTRTTTAVSFDKILNRVLEAVKNDGSLIELRSAGNKIDFVKAEMLDFLQEVADSNGFVDGTALATLRNKLSSMASSNTLLVDGHQAAMNSVWRRLKDVVDDTIVSQLPEAERAAFAQHRAMYTTRLSVDAAVSKATNSTQRGAFTPEDWIAATNTLYRNQSAVDRSPLRQEAFAALDTTSAAQQALVSASQEATALNAQRQIAQLLENETALVSEIAGLEQQLSQIASRAPKQATAEMLRLTRTGAVQTEAALKAKEQELALAKQARDELMSLFPRKGRVDQATPSENLPATVIIGQLVSGIVPALVGGTGLASLFSQPWAQRALAGQTWWQTMLQRAQQNAPAGVFDDAVGGARSAGAGTQDSALISAIQAAPDRRKAEVYRAMVARGSFAEFEKKHPRTAALMKKAATE